MDNVRMKTLNRFALIVRPAGPYIEWAAKAPGITFAQCVRQLSSLIVFAHTNVFLTLLGA